MIERTGHPVLSLCFGERLSVAFLLERVVAFPCRLGQPFVDPPQFMEVVQITAALVKPLGRFEADRGVLE